ncbi:MAG TPA: NUDIX domain-containing protein [Candidatus Limnocylindria bacterium]|nr:NUDIX domain-containing protein [Candidatus Limnocylindria bacterium]
MTSLDARPPAGVEVLHRRAARALILDRHDRLLLFVGLDPDRPERGSWWFTPGGGLNAGEDETFGLCREVREETGLNVDPALIGSPVWHRVAEFLFAGQWYRQSEHFYLLRVTDHVVDTTGFEPLEASAVQGHRWWDLDALASTDDVVYPSALAVELRRLLEVGPPSEPYEVA